MKDEDLRVGVIGLGFGANHARILGVMPGVSLVAVADASSERRERFGSGGVHAYESHTDMLTKQRLHAVAIAVPASMHTSVSLDAIAAGCAVLVEKPLAPSHQDAQSIVEAANEAGVVLMPGHIERFNPAVVELAQRVQAGEVGRVLQVTARRMSATRAGEHGSRLPPFDVNVVHDSAIHDIDVVRYLLGLEVDSVYAVAQAGIVTLLEDAISATLRFSPGEGNAGPHVSGSALRQPVASLEVNWLAPRRVRDLTVLGEHGMFLLDYAAQSLTLYTAGDAMAHEIPVVRQDQLEAELSAFVRAVRDGVSPPVTAEDGLAAVAIADAVTKSARTGKPVKLQGDAA